MMTREDHAPPARAWRRPEGGEPGYVYEWVAAYIADRINSGELPVYARLPSEKRLAVEYGVSLGSARHATRILRERGFVMTIRSKGTFVAPRNAKSD
ncbi:MULTISPECIES: winged helix-turn-helix domain-containing protein [Amycolatopsis]|uniref:GntR family transcriptional regulator n=1 Tax=Amycolatopsis TaxID=1813 RepID=UPI0018E913AD|nr:MULTISPECIES: winged helix-turn-helix domain-containing protein [Amycolatopsis]